jgi:hypothetical protein
LSIFAVKRDQSDRGALPNFRRISSRHSVNAYDPIGCPLELRYCPTLAEASPISANEMSSNAKSFHGPDVFWSSIDRAAVVLAADGQMAEYWVHAPGVGFALRLLPTAVEFTYAWKVGSD